MKLAVAEVAAAEKAVAGLALGQCDFSGRGGRGSGHTFCNRMDALLSLRRNHSDWEEEKEKDLCRPRRLKESVSCCLPQESGMKIAHRPLGPPTLRVHLQSPGYTHSPKY